MWICAKYRMQYAFSQFVIGGYMCINAHKLKHIYVIMKKSAWPALIHTPIHKNKLKKKHKAKA